MKLITKFAVAGSTLDVVAITRKNDLRVFVRSREDGKRSSVGCRSKFEMGEEALAEARYHDLVARAVAAGWVRKPVGTSFTEIPAAPVPAATNGKKK